MAGVRLLILVFKVSEMVRKHIANEHNETMPPSMYEYFHGAIWRNPIPYALETDWPVGAAGFEVRRETGKE